MAVAGLLGTAEGQVGLRANGRRVHVDTSGVQIASGLEGAVHVARIDGGGQTIRHTIRYVDSLLKSVDGDYRHHRAKDLLLRHAHFRRAIAKHGRRVEPALVVEPLAAGEQVAAFGEAELDEALDGLAVRAGDERALHHLDVVGRDELPGHGQAHRRVSLVIGVGHLDRVPVHRGPEVLEPQLEAVLFAGAVLGEDAGQREQVAHLDRRVGGGAGAGRAAAAAGAGSGDGRAGHERGDREAAP